MRMNLLAHLVRWYWSAQSRWLVMAVGKVGREGCSEDRSFDQEQVRCDQEPQGPKRSASPDEPIEVEAEEVEPENESK